MTFGIVVVSSIFDLVELGALVSVLAVGFDAIAEVSVVVVAFDSIIV
jgi:hypothetical protein